MRAMTRNRCSVGYSLIKPIHSWRCLLKGDTLLFVSAAVKTIIDINNY